MNRALTLAASALALAPGCAGAQSMQAMQMPGMDMSKPMPAKKRASATTAAPRKKAPAKKPPPPKRGAAAAAPTSHAHAQPSGTMAGMEMSSDAMARAAPSGTDLPPGKALPPPVPRDHYADRTFAPEQMLPARAMFRHDNGGETFSQIMFNLAEIQIRDGRDGYRWEGEGWFGGDFNRFVVKSEGEGTFGKGVDAAEVQALYSRAIGPYFDLQAGVRHNFQPSPTQTYATVAIEGVAPYKFKVEGALFLSTKGKLLVRTEGSYDEHITQRLILQPRVEFNFAAQDMREDRIGAGLTDAELGVRLRYEISRQFAPYIGVSYSTKVGRTAAFARRDGEDVHSTSLVLGIRTWFWGGKLQ